MGYCISRSAAIKASLALGISLLVCGMPLITLALKLPKRGIPGRREPAGSRDELVCVSPNVKPMVALVPEQNRQLTVSDYPTFFYYVPPTIAKSAEFELLDENYEVVYKTILPIQGAPGVVGVSLPPNQKVPALKVGKSYAWYFALKCDPKNTNKELYVKGWITRIPLSSEVNQKIQKATPAERPAIYANAGIWPESLTALANLRRNDPKNKSLQNDWMQLLQSVNLADYSKEPLTTCCQFPAPAVRSSR